MDKIRSLMATEAGFGALFLRVPVGLILTGHGAQKLFGWFNGYGVEDMSIWLHSIGLSPSTLLAILAGSAEFFGGIMLVVGLLTRAAALAVAIVMIVAILVVHLGSGLFLPDGYEYALTLLSVSVALFIQGGGSYSIDRTMATKG